MGAFAPSTLMQRKIKPIENKKTMKDMIDPKKQATRSDVYRWPQKVKRYGLDLHPFLRLFVGLYENTVPWNKHSKGWNAALLNEYIRDTLLPALEPTDCSGSLDDPFGAKYYLKNVALEAALQADEHAELVALRPRVSSDPEGVKAAVLHFFNKRKQLRFREWWDVMHTEYPDNPAWIYCVLKSVFDDCGRGVRRAPDRVEQRAVHTMAVAVQQGNFVPGAGLVSIYVMQRMRLLTGTARYLHHGWTRIPGISNGEPTKEGVSLLAFLGRKGGWCVASETLGRSYLSRCDFFVLCDRDTPVIGARIGKEAIQEAAGCWNGPLKHRRDLELLRRIIFPNHKGFSSYNRDADTDSWSDSHWVEALKRFPFGWEHAPAHLRKDPVLKNEVFAALLRQAALDPFWARHMPLEFSGRPELADIERISWLSHLENLPVQPSTVPTILFSDPEMVRALEKGWETFAQSTPLYAEQIPEQIFQKDIFKRHWAKGWRRELFRCASTWERIPATLRAMPSIQKTRINGWKILLRRSVDQWRHVPHELAGLPEVKEAWSSGWASQLERYTHLWDQVPQELREVPKIKAARLTGFKLAIKQRAQRWSEIPEEFKGIPEVREAWIQGWEAELLSSTYSWRRVPDELQELPQIKAAWVGGWEASLRRCTSWWMYVPSELKKLPQIKEACVIGWEAEIRRCPDRAQCVPYELVENQRLFPKLRVFWLHHLTNHPVNLSAIPKELSSEPEIVKAWEDGWLLYVSTSDLDIDKIPSQIAALDSFKPFWVRGWQGEVLRSPLSWLRVPSELKGLPGLRQACVQGWESELRHSPERWRYLPPELAAEPCIREGWIQGWEAQLGREPESWKHLPEELKPLPNITEAMIKGWDAALRLAPESWRHISEEVRQLPQIREAWIAGWEQSLGRFPQGCGRIPEEVIERSRLSSKVRALWQDYLAKTPVHPSKVPKPLSRDPDIAKAMEAGWQVYAASKPLEVAEIPEQVLESAAFKTHWVHGWELELVREPKCWAQVPRALREVPALTEARLKGWDASLGASMEAWNELPSEIADLPRFRKAWESSSRTYLASLRRVVVDVPAFVCREKDLFAQWDSILRQALSEGCVMGRYALWKTWVRYASMVPVRMSEAPEAVRSDACFQTAWRECWLRQMRSPWSERFLARLADEGLLERVLEGWVKLNAAGSSPCIPALPAGVCDALARMASDLSERKIMRHPGVKVLRWLEQNPWTFEDLPQGQKDHPFLWRACRDGWLHYLKLFPRFEEVLPGAFSSDPKISAVLRTNAVERESFEEKRKADKLARGLAALKAAPGFTDEELPREFAKNRELRKARQRHWRRIIAKNPRAFPRVPRSLQRDAELLASLRGNLGPEIRSNPLLWETLHETIRADECLQRVHRIATRAGVRLAPEATAAKAA